jgi:hypothetical protein
MNWAISVAKEDDCNIIDAHLLAFVVHYKIYNKINKVLLQKVCLIASPIVIQKKLYDICNNVFPTAYDNLHQSILNYFKYITVSPNDLYLFNCTTIDIAKAIKNILCKRFEFRRYFAFRWYENGIEKKIRLWCDVIDRYIYDIVQDLVKAWKIFLRDKRLDKKQMKILNKRINMFKKDYFISEIRKKIQTQILSEAAYER